MVGRTIVHAARRIFYALSNRLAAGKTRWYGKPLEKEIYVAGPASATPPASYAP
jgi:hypothetical protein